MPGPAPDPNALRRDRKDDKGSWTTLPTEGRQGTPPRWPLPNVNKAELKQWAREWTRPQAVMWERDHQEEEVAVYVRTLLRSDGYITDPSLLNALMRMQNNLGLSQPGLLRLRWRIDEVPAQRMTTKSDDPDRAATKARLRAIAGGAA